MNITVLGIIVIIMSIYAFFKNEKLLLYMLVFFSTFTAGELFHLEIIKAPMQTFEFIGAVWLLREFINFIKTKPKFSREKIIKKFKENKLASALVVFMILSIIGEAFAIISGLAVEYTKANGELDVAKFSLSNINQFVIITFIFVLMTVLSFKIKSKEEVKNLLKVFCISSIFAVIWGLLQFVTYYLGLQYPAFLFNNNVYALQCYGQIDNNVKRICSIALEPSTFSINLICFIPFVIGAFITLKEKIKEKKYIITFLILAITTVCAILTTSSTSYAGLVIAYGLFGLYCLFGFIKKGELDNRKKTILRLIIVAGISGIIAACACIVSIKVGYKLNTIQYITIQTTGGDQEKEEPIVEYNSALDNMINTLKQMTINKLLSHSGQERLTVEGTGLDLFKNSPIFGIGFGTYRTLSLFTNVLLSTGLIGLGSFMYIFYVVLKSVVKYRKKEEMISVAFFISIVATALGLFLSVPDFVLTFYWIILVLAYKYTSIEN